MLSKILGERLLFPTDFIGRGDMSRGGLMLRCVDEDRELAYVAGAGSDSARATTTETGQKNLPGDRGVSPVLIPHPRAFRLCHN